MQLTRQARPASPLSSLPWGPVTALLRPLQVRDARALAAGVSPATAAALEAAAHGVALAALGGGQLLVTQPVAAGTRAVRRTELLCEHTARSTWRWATEQMRAPCGASAPCASVATQRGTMRRCWRCGGGASCAKAMLVLVRVRKGQLQLPASRRSRATSCSLAVAPRWWRSMWRLRPAATSVQRCCRLVVVRLVCPMNYDVV